MTTKDYIYLGMIVLTALAFYCNGFYAGVYRCKKMYDSLLDDSEQDDSSSGPNAAIGKAAIADDNADDNSLSIHPPERNGNILISNRELRGDFGKN
jgi:hypothetical protein